MKIPKASSEFLRKAAAVRMAFWVLNAVAVALIFFYARPLWTKISVLYLVLVSLYANLATDATNYQAARVEVKVDEQADTTTVDVETNGPVGVERP